MADKLVKISKYQRECYKLFTGTMAFNGLTTLRRWVMGMGRKSIGTSGHVDCNTSK